MSTELGKLSIAINIDDQDMQKSLAAIKRDVKAASNQFKASSAGVDKYNASIDELKRQQTSLEKVIASQYTETQKLEQAWNEAIKTKGKGSAEEKKLEAQYYKSVEAMRKSEAQYKKLGEQIQKKEADLKQLNAEMKKQSTVSYKMGQALEDVSKQMKDAGNSISDLSQKIEPMSKAFSMAGTVIAGAFGAIGAAAFNAAKEVDDAQTMIQVRLGATQEEANKYAKQAQDIWANGWGESIDEVGDAIVKVSQNLKGIDPSEYNRVVESAFTLTKVTGADLNESLRGINGLMENFGITSDEAFDYMIRGAQRGLNKSMELEDNVAEYSQLWNQAGFEANEMFAVLENGLIYKPLISVMI
ncbi:Phage-related minor tail protein [Mesobacillus persicus]|uniref:Phage-related minor tail protein n=1 Tax=Mesobacillus persicus TaxID=930146 RepID=A0A1H7XM71_9BACI|nr:phage tail tape measure protein [Mesobacillus persicus]SEM34743.1 Phage-related minor tail protein [Mesobacillus persicus]